MKAHLYETAVSEGAMEAMHSMGSPQRKLYFPGVGVLAYGFQSNNKVDYFSNSLNHIREAENAIKGVFEESYLIKNKQDKYIGEVEVPDKLAKEVVSLGETLIETKRNLDKKGKSLVALVNRLHPFKK